MRMTQTVTCRIVDCPDGRFAVVAVLGSGSVYRCHHLRTLAEAEEAVDALQALMTACGARLVMEAGGYRVGDAQAVQCSGRFRR